MFRKSRFFLTVASPSILTSFHGFETVFDQWTKYCDQHFFFINCSGFFENNSFTPYLFTYRGVWRFGSGSKSSGLGVKKLLICFDCATLVSSPTISYNQKRQQPNLFNLNQKIKKIQTNKN